MSGIHLTQQATKMQPTVAAGDEPEHTAPTLLKIPRELRDQIYSHLLVSAEGIIDPLHWEQWHEASQAAVRHHVSLVRTCRQLRLESEMHFFENNIVAFSAFVGHGHRLANLEQFVPRIRHLAVYLLGRVRASRAEKTRLELCTYALEIRLRESGLDHQVYIKRDALPNLPRARDYYDGRTEDVVLPPWLEKTLPKATELALGMLARVVEEQGKLDVASLENVLYAVESIPYY